MRVEFKTLRMLRALAAGLLVPVGVCHAQAQSRADDSLLPQSVQVLKLERENRVKDFVEDQKTRYLAGLEKLRTDWVAQNKVEDALAALKLKSTLKETSDLDLTDAEIATLPDGLKRVVEAWRAAVEKENAEANEALANQLEALRVGAIKKGDLGLVRILEEEKEKSLESTNQSPGGGEEVVASGPEDPAEQIPLTTLKPTLAEVGYEPQPLQIVHQNKARAIQVGGRSFPSYIFAHAKSKVRFDVPEGVNRFTATGGCSHAGGNVKFLVFFNKRTRTPEFESPESKPNGQLVKIDVEIPPEAKTIDLVVDTCGNGTADHSFWADPVFFRIPR